MEKSNLENFIRGWIVGAFKPSIYSTNDVEFAIQKFQKGDIEASHCHKIATEITVIVSGKALMKGQLLSEGDVVKIAPGEFTDFEALEDTTTAVLKLPGALNDKYLEKEEN
ncbi:hypothetical protein AADZ84_11090 [Colwelliaceae bacterium MEBiC 14330]